MAKPISWTPEMDAVLLGMRRDGKSISDCAARLGISKNAAISRCDRLGLVTGVAFRLQHRVVREDERGDEPLPAGHPISWGAISRSTWETRR